MARRFMYVSLGILALALAYNVGASRTEAQGQAGLFVAMFSSTSLKTLALTDQGDVWEFDPNASPGNLVGTFLGNIPGGPVPVEGSSFGAIRGAFRD